MPVSGGEAQQLTSFDIADGIMVESPEWMPDGRHIVYSVSSRTGSSSLWLMDTETRETLFNVATPVIGSYDYTFDRPGVYDVSCHTHPAMAAFIVVTSTPYAAVADRDGHFVIEGIERGSYVARVWNVEASRRSEREVTIDETTATLSLLPP